MVHGVNSFNLIMSAVVALFAILPHALAIGTPTMVPVPVPSSLPTPAPTALPVPMPTKLPIPAPTALPIPVPTSVPSQKPTSTPTFPPSSNPTLRPSLPPTSLPTLTPSSEPTPNPSQKPSSAPTPAPTLPPTSSPTAPPNPLPTPGPTFNPTPTPTTNPSSAPTLVPTLAPTSSPSPAPTSIPSPVPTFYPTPTPTTNPSSSPTLVPTLAPTSSPSPAPTSVPSPLPTLSPTPIPTLQPSSAPTSVPTLSPTSSPSPVPTPLPTPVPTLDPTSAPTPQPSPAPTSEPTPLPTPTPTSLPTPIPTLAPTPVPTFTPTSQPTPLPSSNPTPSPTPLPTISLLPTPSPTPYDTVELTVTMQIYGDGVCNLVKNHTQSIRDLISAAMVVKGNSSGYSSDDITAISFTGCDDSRRRRRRLLAERLVTVSMTFTTSLSEGNYLTADGIYDAVSLSLKEAKADLQTAFETTCNCTVNVATIQVTLSTRWEPEETIYVPPTPAPRPVIYNGADCPNGCSGHGSCSTNGCVCYDNWGNGDETGGACDERKCPYEIAWVDIPSAENKAHALRECAGRGVCDRWTGNCACFPGYEGKGCKRSSCPNGCSGHGTCEFISELRNDLGDDFKWTGNKPTRSQYDFEFPLMWDAHKTRACVCDPKYSGLDCSTRMCPRGDYAHFYALEKRHETQALVFTNVFNPVTDGSNIRDAEDNKLYNDNAYKVDMGLDSNQTETNGEFALTFRSTLNEEFTTTTLNVYNLTEDSMEEAINALPNKVVLGAEVTLYRNLSKYNVTEYASHAADNLHQTYASPYPFDPAFNYTWYDTDLVVTITFNGGMTAGDVYALECKTAYCGSGCQPKLEHPLDFKRGSECHVINDYTPARSVNYECSGRGQCNEITGVCECFQGYADEYCSTRRAII